MEYMNIRQLVESKRYPFSYGQMRHFMSKRKENGLSKAIKKIGKGIYLDLALFDEWIASHKDGE